MRDTSKIYHASKNTLATDSRLEFDVACGSRLEMWRRCFQWCVSVRLAVFAKRSIYLSLFAKLKSDRRGSVSPPPTIVVTSTSVVDLMSLWCDQPWSSMRDQFFASTHVMQATIMSATSVQHTESSRSFSFAERPSALCGRHARRARSFANK